jgi:hypothetical protein
MPPEESPVFPQATGGRVRDPARSRHREFRNHHQRKLGKKLLHLLDGGGNQVFGSGRKENLDGLVQDPSNQGVKGGLERVGFVIVPQGQCLCAKRS